MAKRLLSKLPLLVCALVFLLAAFCLPATTFAASVPQEDTPDYKVAFYASANYHIQDDLGTRSGYGYEMMQSVSKYMQCTFSYVGYDKTPAECEEMLREGDIDIYTAAKITPERQAEFAISTHPAITATTSMNVKVGNTSVVAGDYSTYNGLRIGLLARHTYNNAFLQLMEDRGIDCEIVYYDTPTELTNALINDEVDALVNSYIRTPEDERTVEEFGQTPYYIMARKEDQALIDQIDAAIDRMNVETPNWRTDLFNKYYGEADKNCDFTADEEALLSQMQQDGVVVRAVMNPDNKPYSWYEDGQARGIAADIFKETAEQLGLAYEIVPVSSAQEYKEAVSTGTVDVWIDSGGGSESEAVTKYRISDPYLTTSVSVVRQRGTSGRVSTLAVADYGSSVEEILARNLPDVQVTQLSSEQECLDAVKSGSVDGALLMTYAAQEFVKQDVTNSLEADILPGAALSMSMGVNANDDRDFFGLWEKTLYQVANEHNAAIVQSYIEEAETPSFIAFLFDHPMILITVIGLALLVAFLVVLYLFSMRARNRQRRISDQLAVALAEAQDAIDAKQDFFSKMSHDIRTPLNAVLGMTQIARKYENHPKKLDSALRNISSEGNYLLMLINSILDVNQLEHGHLELKNAPFSPAVCVREAVEMLRPLASKHSQKVTLVCEGDDAVVVGDEGRFGQIVVNIVSNAVKYTGDGGSINVTLCVSPTGACRFECIDNGMGMDTDFVAHITEDYARAEDSRVSKIQGTGLGMSVVKGLTDLMGGTLSVHSEKGAGSAFIVEIPFAPASDEQREAVRARAEARVNYQELFRGKKVLLAEDNGLNAEIAMELLGTLGLEVDWAEDGRGAVDMFEASKVGEYYAVFMDMQMPVMDGLAATRAIRASGRDDANVPIFAMTANAFAADRRACHDAGMDGYISKPINAEKIAHALKDNIEG